MKFSLGLVLFLAACKPPSPEASSLSQELTLLRDQVGRIREELAKSNQPKLEAVEAMDDLAREVKKMTSRMVSPAASAPAPTPPPGVVLPPAVLLPVASLSSGGIQGGVGGTQAGINDLFWVLAKTQASGEDRTVLCLYRALGDRSGFRLEGVRMLNFDQQMIELNAGNKPSVKEVQEALKKFGK